MYNAMERTKVKQKDGDHTADLNTRKISNILETRKKNLRDSEILGLQEKDRRLSEVRIIEQKLKDLRGSEE